MSSIRAALALVVTAAAVSLVACSSSSSSGGAPSATRSETTSSTTITGAAGGGGAGGAATTTSSVGGSGAGGGGSTTTSSASSTTSTEDPCTSCYPACYLALVAPCRPADSCTLQRTKSGPQTISDYCYGNGVKEHQVEDGATTTDTRYLPNGAVCFSVDIEEGATDVTTTYADANGAVAFVETHTKGKAAYEVACGGQTYQVDPMSASCTACAKAYPFPGCAQGSCTAP
jgi:hypothetical protein